MIELNHDVFADTVFWIALIVKQDQYHASAQEWALKVTGNIVTTFPVLLETTNALSRPHWRTQAMKLIDHIADRPDVEILPFSLDQWNLGLDLYRQRPDKGWSLTDCISFVAMQQRGLEDALTADDHFKQAGFRPLMA